MDVLNRVIESYNEPCRELISLFITQKKFELYKPLYHKLPDDILTTMIHNEIKHIFDLDYRLYDQANRLIWKPNYKILGNNPENKNLFITMICGWLVADLDVVYFYNGDNVIKLDRTEFLTKGLKTKNQRETCDKPNINKLLNEGLLILKVFRGHYLTFFRDPNTGSYIGISSLDFGLEEDL